MTITRRKFLGTLGAIGAGTLLPRAGALADGNAVSDVEFAGVLVDTTKCIGCRKCELACALANDKPVPDIEDKSVFAGPRTTSTTAWTVVNRYETEKGGIYVKRQCMHCNQPACTSACLVRALYKMKNGPVIWRENKCMGCRYCMISCPFDVPKFEYEKAIPDIQKCHFCFTRLEEGKKPACVEACPAEALVFGSRRDLLRVARSRIAAYPDRYYNHIYGETEAGGTGWMYLAGVPFDRIGFKTGISPEPYPEFTKGFLYSVPFVFVLLPTFLLGISRLASRKDDLAHDQHQENAEPDRDKETSDEV